MVVILLVTPVNTSWNETFHITSGLYTNSGGFPYLPWVWHSPLDTMENSMQIGAGTVTAFGLYSNWCLEDFCVSLLPMFCLSCLCYIIILKRLCMLVFVSCSMLAIYYAKCHILVSCLLLLSNIQLMTININFFKTYWDLIEI